MKRGAWLALAALIALPLMAMGQSARHEVGTQYRWTYWNDANATTWTTIRFPRYTDAPPIIADADSIRSVYWLSAALLRAAPVECKIIVYSPAFPAGEDTLRLTINSRTLTVGGFKIDSLKVYNTDAADDLHIYVTD